jgi:1-deoxy-D-xylulose-5-phosphate synthase
MISLAKQVAQHLAAQGLQAGIVNPRFIVPLDRDLLSRHATTARCIATFENGIVTGGFGSRVNEVLADIGYRGTCLRFGWPDQFVPQGSFDALAERFGLTAPAIAERIGSVMK